MLGGMVAVMWLVRSVVAFFSALLRAVTGAGRRPAARRALPRRRARQGRGRFGSPLVIGLAGVLVVAMVPAVFAARSALIAPTAADLGDAGNVVTLPAARRAQVTLARPASVKPRPVVAPKAGTATVAVTSAAAPVPGGVLSVSAAAKGAATVSPVTVDGVKVTPGRAVAAHALAATRGGATGAASPGSVTVTTLDPAQVKAFGGDLLGFTVQLHRAARRRPDRSG